MGLQGLFLVESLIPETLRAAFVAIAVQWGHNRDSPEALYSLTFFPYVLVFVGLGDRLYRQGRIKQARFGEGLALALGVVLAILSIAIPGLRFLNLSFSAVTLAVVSYRRSSPQPSFIYFSHCLGLWRSRRELTGNFPG
ncbi:MAG: hypothetical protein HC890_13430 [Chloroflexaceae bacterium]|nr:hypothetical protein [Chloroflexaceae bacterium]